MQQQTEITAERAASKVERFTIRAAEVRNQLAMIRAHGLNRDQADRLERKLASYEARIASNAAFWREDIAESALIRFGRNGYAPHIDSMVASARVAA